MKRFDGLEWETSTHLNRLSEALKGKSISAEKGTSAKAPAMTILMLKTLRRASALKDKNDFETFFLIVRPEHPEKAQLISKHALYDNDSVEVVLCSDRGGRKMSKSKAK